MNGQVRQRRSLVKCRVALAACVAVYLSIPKEVLAQPAPRQAPPQLWFAPMQGHVDLASQTVSWTYHDFLAMLVPDAPWQHAAHRIDAMMFDSTHAVEGFSRNGVPSMPEIHAMLTRIGVKAAGGGGVVYTGGYCQGGAVEGTTGDKDYAHEVVATTKTWHDLGLPMNYFVMDSPFFFGYEVIYDKCHLSIEDVAERAATTMKMIKALYPNIVIIDAEGPGPKLPAQWLPDYHRFLAAFRSDYGAPIDYLDMDLHWVDAWHTGYAWVSAAKEIAEDMHKQGVRVSLIVDAEDQNWDPEVPPPDPAASARVAMTAEYWMAAVRKHIELIKKNAIPLDALDLEDWMRFPRNNLPEGDPQAWASVVNYMHDMFTPTK
jgi:hypothetical protein